MKNMSKKSTSAIKGIQRNESGSNQKPLNKERECIFFSGKMQSELNVYLEPAYET